MNDYVPYKRGDRVYIAMNNDAGQEKRRYGVVSTDEIEFFDYIDVRWDDGALDGTPVVTWYLHRAQADDELTGLVILDADGEILKHEPHERAVPRDVPTDDK